MERIFTIPLRKAYRKPRTRRTPTAMRLIKLYLQRHMKLKNSDIEIKIGKHLNETLWNRGIRYPPRRVRVKAVLDEEKKQLKCELVGFEYKEFTPVKQEAKKEGVKEKLMKRLGGKALQKQKEEEMIEGKKKEEKTEKKPRKKEGEEEKHEEAEQKQERGFKTKEETEKAESENKSEQESKS
ncbi:MAG: 50S ribosomal protein L31e [Candidatus Aenigmarchaeota archaeon]|nr:50S ribosomal protein L31e [Candidatus Aenigmarchaeota archaeon]